MKPELFKLALRRIVIGAALSAILVLPAAAGYKEDVGFTRLQSELGSALPTGTNVPVTQVEARTSYGDPLGPYMPDTADTQFAGKRIVKKTDDAVTGASGHATGVGRLFYGASSSLSPGISDVDVYEAGDWCGQGFLMSGATYQGKPIQPHYSWPSVRSSPSRAGSHSWVGASRDPSYDADILRRLDFVVAADGFIQIAALNNGSTAKPLLADAFNTIAVGRTDGLHPRGSMQLDAVYTAGRVKPDIVAPFNVTSSCAPLAASTVSLLIETGRNPILSTDPQAAFFFNRSGVKIYNAERPVVIKAALMAGAARVTRNTTAADITGYRVNSADRSTNGLDLRFGAGQMDIYHSHHIIAAGEQNSAEDLPAGQGRIGRYGFDFDPAFGGGDSSNPQASYHFTAGRDQRMLYASLVWNLKIDGGVWNNFNGAAILYDMDLFLEDVTDPAYPRMVAASNATGENTENLWTPLSPGRSYRLQIRRAEGQAAFRWDYALAWRMTTPPDTDADGMPDDWEVYHGLNPLDPADGGADPDGDGLSSAAEFDSGTDPRNPDSDGDGAGDGAEGAAGSDPLDPLSAPQAVPVPGLTLIGALAAAALLSITPALLDRRVRGTRRSSRPNRKFLAKA